jgi:hypothetical protein
MSPDQRRWKANAEKVAMALNETGHPCHFEDVSFHVGGWREDVIVFHGATPPLDVLVKAGDVCGIGDLMRRLYDPDNPSSDASSDEGVR